MEKIIRNEKEAIEVIKSNYPTSGYYMLCEALDMAISALEKQIPMKAKFENREIIRHRHNPKGKPEWEKLIKADWLCSNCKSPVGEDNYCGYCGQCLAWSDADE